MKICHVALQGCLQLANVRYGITPDTDEHIRFLLELVNVSAGDPAIKAVDIVTRGFVDAQLGSQFGPDVGEIRNKIRLIRLQDDTPGYLPKEDLWREHDRLCKAFGAFIESKLELPDLIHAHHIDAAVLATFAKQRFGIPFVYTGQINGVITEASAVIGCSQEEATAEYQRYRSLGAVASG